MNTIRAPLPHSPALDSSPAQAKADAPAPRASATLSEPGRIPLGGSAIREAGAPVAAASRLSSDDDGFDPNSLTFLRGYPKHGGASA